MAISARGCMSCQQLDISFLRTNRPAPFLLALLEGMVTDVAGISWFRNRGVDRGAEQMRRWLK